MIFVAALASLRFGEISALRRADFDLASATVAVRDQFLEIRGQGLILGPPKSRARCAADCSSGALLPQVRSHLDRFVDPSPSALVFTTARGVPVRRGSFNKLVNWRHAVDSIGMPGFHFHDLRHTGNMLAAGSKATTRDLISRMGP